MAVPNVKHTVAIPAGGLNIDAGGAIPVQVYSIRALNAFGPYFKVDAVGATNDATNANYLSTQEPEKMRGLGEYGGQDSERTVVIDLLAGQRISLKPAPGEAPTGIMYVEITAEQPFTI